MLSEAALAAAGLDVTLHKPGLPGLNRDSLPGAGSGDNSPAGRDIRSEGNVSSRGGGGTRGHSKQGPQSPGSGPPVGLLGSLGFRHQEPAAAPGPEAPGARSLCGRCAACGLVCEDGAWSPPRQLAGQDEAEMLGRRQVSVLLEDKRMLNDISESMMGKLNNVLVFLQQTVSRERGKHSSDISMMMRKVDKDLKDTFLNVRETFAGLTDQLTQLVKEVENSRKQVKSIQAKYAAAKEAAEAQAQYVVELEAVLDSQGSGLSEVLKKLSGKYSDTQQSLAKLTEEGKQRVQQLQRENKDLKMRLRRFETEEKELKAAKEPPALPEMTASWTRHMTPSSQAASAPGSPRAPSSARRGGSALSGGRPGSQGGQAYASTVVSSMMAHCDAKRSAPRTKVVHAQEPRAPSPPLPGFRARDDDQVPRLRRRTELAEGRCRKQHRLMTFASGGLLLLRDIFLELRHCRCLTASDELKASKSMPAVEAATVVERIVQLFSGAAPRLGDLAEVIAALGEEAARPPPGGGGPAELDAVGGGRTLRSPG